MKDLMEGPGECPTCGKDGVVAHPSGVFQHCFVCGANIRQTGAKGVQAVLEGVFATAHAALLKSRKHMRTLTAERKLHRQVVVDSMLGISSGIDVEALVKLELEAAEQHLAKLQAEMAAKRGRPSNADMAALDRAVRAVDTLVALRSDLSAFLEEHRGWLLFFYTTAQHEIARIRAHSPDGEHEADFKTGGVFNHALFPPGEHARSLENLVGTTFVVASEFDALQLQSLAARLAEAEGIRAANGYLRVAAVGSGDVDVATLEALGRMPWVVKNGVQLAAGSRMVDQIRQRLNLHTVLIPTPQTFDDFVRKYASDEAAQQVLIALAGTRRLLTRPFSAVGSDIDWWRSLEPALKPFEADRYAGNVLTRDVTERGLLFYDGRQAYVFLHDTKVLLPVDRDNAEMQLFLNRYGIAPNDRLFKHALNALRLTAQEEGTKTTVHSLSHYDGKTNRVYLFDHDRHIYRISESKIEKVDNGTDAVLFVRNAKWEPFVIGTPTGNGKLLTDVLLGSVRLQEESLSRTEQESLFAHWLFGMLLPELFPTRPLLAMIGEKGSGKTSVLRRIGQLLFGPNFQVMGMSHEPKDFDAAVTGDAFVAIDNADGDVAWLDDKLAVVATGGTLKRRLLYTTNQLVEFPVTAFVGITSRTPHFKREDIADRLLLFHVERLEAFGAEGQLLGELTAQRNLLMTELVGELQRILRALRLTKAKAYSTTFRLADFAQFMLRMADAEGQLANAEATLNRLSAEQLAFTAQDDAVIELLEDWVASNPGREVTTGTLFMELKTLAALSQPQRAFDFRTSIAFGLYLQSNRATLRALFGAEDRTIGGRKRVWGFHTAALKAA